MNTNIVLHHAFTFVKLGQVTHHFFSMPISKSCLNNQFQISRWLTLAESVNI